MGIGSMQDCGLTCMQALRHSVGNVKRSRMISTEGNEPVMEPNGYLRNMMDLKILILYVTARLDAPVKLETLYELCYIDSALSYFDFCDAVPDLVHTGHLCCDEQGFYSITEKGKENGRETEDSLARSARTRADALIENHRRTLRRNSLISTQVLARKDGEISVMLKLRDGVSTLMTLELMAPSEIQAHRLERAFQKNAESVYQQVMTILLNETEKKEN